MQASFGRALGMVCLGLVCGAAAISKTIAAEQPLPLSSVAQIRALTPEEGSKAFPVKTRTLVTFFDRVRSQLHLQENGTGVSVIPAPGLASSMTDIYPGQIVEVEGTTTGGRTHCNIRAQSIRIVGTAPLPPPLELTAAKWLPKNAESRLVSVRGWVPTVARSGTRLTFQLMLRAGQGYDVLVVEGDAPEARDLAGSFAQVTGVLTFRYDSTGRRVGGALNVQSLSTVRKLKPVPLTTIAGLNKSSAAVLGGEPVRLRADVVNHSLGEFLVVRDNSGSLRIPFKGLTYYNAGTLLEIFAWPVQVTPEPIFTNLTLRLVLPDTGADEPAVALISPARANRNLKELTQVAQVRKLSPQEASRGYPIRVSGVITYCDIPAYLHFVQDETAGIYLDLSRMTPKPQIRAGQQVEIEGFSGPGNYAPIVVAQRIRIVGRGEFPIPETVTLRKLLTGSYDSQWVSLLGVIRNQWTRTNITILGLFTGESLIKVNIPEPARQPAVRNYIDTAVEVHGVCTSLTDDRRRLSGIELHVPDWARIEIKESGAGDPFLLPVKPVSDLFQFHAAKTELHRIRLMGVVTLCMSDGSFYFQDASGGIEVQNHYSTVSAKVGATVDVVGFPALQDWRPVLQDATFKVVKDGTPVDPSELTTESALDGSLHATLVKLQGRVARRSAHDGIEMLTLESDDALTQVLLEHGGRARELDRVVTGSIVKITGVCLTDWDSAGRARLYRVQLRSAADVEVISQPPWWTWQHTLWALGAFALVLLVALVTVRSLRRQVQLRTHELGLEIDEHKKTEARLEAEIVERQRMEAEVQKTHQELLRASRQAGMAEVATSVLHNVGNVLNSVNVSAGVVADQLKSLRIENLRRVAGMLSEHPADLAGFLSRDPRGQRLPQYLNQLTRHLEQERGVMQSELQALRKNIDHIKEIVAMQQSYARVRGVMETLNPTELLEDAVRINQESLARHKVKLLREYEPRLPKITVDKHKALQVLVNLISNAKKACTESAQADKQVLLRVTNGHGRLKISVIDNGIGMPAENLTRIFHHGFTTRKDGHGFGLHSGALAAKEMGGALLAQSDGLGRGANFTLELPAT